MADSTSNRKKRNPILGAAVLKALLIRRKGTGGAQALALYEGVLRDLQLSDEEVERYLSEHADQVEEAIRSHGRRG